MCGGWHHGSQTLTSLCLYAFVVATPEEAENMSSLPSVWVCPCSFGNDVFQFWGQVLSVLLLVSMNLYMEKDVLACPHRKMKFMVQSCPSRAWPTLGELPPTHWWMCVVINNCCFKPLSMGAICQAAVASWCRNNSSMFETLKKIEKNQFGKESLGNYRDKKCNCWN